MRIEINILSMMGIVMALLFCVPGCARAEDGYSKRLIFGGSPSSSLVRTEPMAPFVVFEPGVVGRTTKELASEENAKAPNRMRRNILLYGGILGGAGLYMAAGRCGNEGGTVCRVWAHWGPLGFGVGAGVGALVTVLTE